MCFNHNENHNRPVRAPKMLCNNGGSNNDVQRKVFLNPHHSRSCSKNKLYSISYWSLNMTSTKATNKTAPLEASRDNRVLLIHVDIYNMYF